MAEPQRQTDAETTKAALILALARLLAQQCARPAEPKRGKGRKAA